MVKCWGICFSLCCALCSPPQRTRGGSNTAATIKKETQSSWGQNKAEGTANITFYCYLLCLQDKDLSQTRSRPQPHKLALTLNSSLKSLPSSAERIRYSSSSESRGMGKYLLDGEGDLGRRTTVCSPAVKGIYGGQTANVSQQRTLQALIAPAKTSLMAIKISYFCGYMTEMISWAINMRLPLLRGAVLTQNLAFPFIYLFFASSESLYGSLRAGEAKSLLKPSQLYLGLQIMKTFPVHKEHKSAIKMKKKKKKKKKA